MAAVTQSFSLNLMPLLARLVLCAAFLPVGWAKITKTVEFDPAQSETLRELGVGTTWLAGSSEPAAPGPGGTSSPPRSDDAAGGDASAGAMSGKSLYRIALMLHEREIPYPCALAWIAALTELVGGALILFGFLTRVWSLGLTINMAMAFWLTSLSVMQTTYGFDLPVEIHNRVFVQCALGVLALWVMVTGPGPVSLDAILFPSSGGKSGGKSSRSTKSA